MQESAKQSDDLLKRIAYLEARVAMLEARLVNFNPPPNVWSPRIPGAPYSPSTPVYNPWNQEPWYSPYRTWCTTKTKDNTDAS